MAAQIVNVSRQWTLAATANLGIASIGAGNEYVVDLPPNAFLTNITAFLITAFDGTGTVTLTGSDGTTTFVNAQTIKTGTTVTVAVNQKFFPSGGKLTFSIADANSNSANGLVNVTVHYVGVLRENEVQY